MADQRNDAPGPGQEPLQPQQPAAAPAAPQPVAAPAANTNRLPVILAGIALAATLGVLGFLAGSNAFKKPTVTATATVTAPIPPAPKAEESKPETAAEAKAVCKDGKPAAAQASGPDAKAVARCGPLPVAKKVVPATGTAKVAPSATTQAKPSDDRLADLVKRLAEENRQLKSAGGGTVATGPVPATFAPAPAYAEEGKVYSDASGNTYERHTAGSRLCRFMVNGEIRKEVFVSHPDPKESKRQCDVLAAQFEASLQPTTPVK
jgi:hypothetical protein